MKSNRKHFESSLKKIFYSSRWYICLFVMLCIIGFPLKNVQAQDFRYRTDYSYDGEFGRLGIADIATCYDQGKMIAKAKAIKIIKKSPGPNHLEVKETHFDAKGSVTYEGVIIFQFGFGGGHLVSETGISGRKRRQVFTGWPAGN